MTPMWLAPEMRAACAELAATTGVSYDDVVRQVEAAMRPSMDESVDKLRVALKAIEMPRAGRTDRSHPVDSHPVDSHRVDVARTQPWVSRRGA